MKNNNAKRLLTLCILTTCTLLTACGEDAKPTNQSDSSSESSMTNATTSADVSNDLENDAATTEISVIPDDEWKQAYLTYLNNDVNAAELNGYTFLYIDDDDIPEIAEIGAYEAACCIILNYSQSEVHSTQLSRLDFFYIPKENLLCNSAGNMGYYYDVVYSIIDGTLTPIANGTWQETGNVTYDADGNPVFEYEYIWDEAPVSEEEYTNSLNAIYDTSKSVAGYQYDNLYSLEDIKAELATN